VSAIVADLERAFRASTCARRDRISRACARKGMAACPRD
jgi:hypothetical protein